MGLFGGVANQFDQGTTFHSFKVKDVDESEVDLSQYKGKIVLVVNVASQCGFTPQYKGLQELYDKYKDKGLVVLGFPCNQFGKQEPGSNAEIKDFACSKQGAKFPIFAKIDVNGETADPLYKFLKQKQGGLLGSNIKWNFTKFLVDREGNVIERYGSLATPAKIDKDIAKLVGQ